MAFTSSGSATLNTDVFNPESLVDAVDGVFAQKTAFMGSRLTSLGVVIVNGSMPVGGPSAIGTTITVPYFNTLGEFVANAEGSAVSPSKISQITETASVSRDSLAFAVSRWAQGNAFVNPAVGDPYVESARQILAAAERAMDKRIITAAAASGVYVKDVYSSSSPRTLDWDLCVDAKFDGWTDEQDDIAAILVHSQTQKDLMKLKDSTGRPLLLSGQDVGGPVDRFCGVPVIVSDRVPITGSTMGSVTATGTSPPVPTLAGTPLAPFRLVVDCVVGGAHGTATYRFSTDGGNIWSNTVTTNATPGTAVALTDTAIDSRVGVNGSTGLTLAFAAGTFNADNLYTSNTSLKAMSMLLKRNALAFWYSRQHLGLQKFTDIYKDTDEAAMHLYAVAHRYRRAAGSTKPGVIQITHNVSGF